MAENTNVILYSKNHCPYCEEAKQFLTENNINYVEYRVDLNPTDAENLRQKTGRTAVPAFVIMPSGETIVGFNPPQLREVLDID